MKLQHTTPMEAFFTMFIFCFSFIMMIAANPTYDYSFLFDYKVRCHSSVVLSHHETPNPPVAFAEGVTQASLPRSSLGAL